MVAVGRGISSSCQHLISPATLPRIPSALSVLSYNVLLPNSQDGWWNYKMYNPPLGPDQKEVSTWEYRKSLLRERINLIDADVVCLQEVSPLSFDEDFAFMAELGYEGIQFKKGRFRPATFWMKDRVELATEPMHKDRTLLTSFRLLPVVNDNEKEGTEKEKGEEEDSCWHVLNCHLQAGKQGGRRLRQIHEGVTTAFKTAKNKLKEKYPENLKLIVCGDFNGSDKECGAVQFLEKGVIDQNFIEDGDQISSKAKTLPISPMIDATLAVDRDGKPPPSTLVVPEIISLMVDQSYDETAYTNPTFTKDVLERLERIYSRFATVPVSSDQSADQMQMGKEDVERWLTVINLQVGRGSEFRSAAKFMGWVDEFEEEDGEKVDKKDRPPIIIPDDGILTLEDFISVYLDELRQGKFWGIAWDLAALGEPLPIEDVFRARYDRMYCSTALKPAVVLDTVSDEACPNANEVSDHLPVCASFIQTNAS